VTTFTPRFEILVEAGASPEETKAQIELFFQRAGLLYQLGDADPRAFAVDRSASLAPGESPGIRDVVLVHAGPAAAEAADQQAAAYLGAHGGG